MHKAVLGFIFIVTLSGSIYAEEAMNDEEGATWKEKLSLNNRLHISGYGNAHYMDHDGVPRFVDSDDLNDGIGQLREFSIFLDYTVSQNVLVSTELGSADNFEELDANYLYLDFDLSSIADNIDSDKYGNLSLRAGKFLVPFLSYNENKPNFKQSLMSQPFTAWQMAPVINSPRDFKSLGWSDTGVMLNWNRMAGPGILDIKVSAIKGLQSDADVLDANYGRLDTVLDMGSGPFNPAVRPRDGLMQNEADDWFDDNNSDPAFTGKVTYRFSAQPLDIGYSWYKGKWDDDADQDLKMVGFHGNWLARRWTLKTEYVKAEVEQEAGINVVPIPGPMPVNVSSGDYEMKSWFIEGSVVPYFYGEDDEKFVRLVARYDEVDTNDEVEFTPWNRSRVTVGMEWQFNSNIRLRYEHQRHTLEDFDNAPMPFIAAGGKEHIDMDMVSIIFWF